MEDFKKRLWERERGSTGRGPKRGREGIRSSRGGRGVCMGKEELDYTIGRKNYTF